MIGTTVSREARARVGPRVAGDGPDVMYDVAGLPKQHALQVPDFDKQITKETQFAGHRVQSERWLAKNPTAPSPGHYDINYSQVEI
ncbi:hypothetical protein STCU_00476 [Strigomonas culicis]|nr:hypothetical protein STCU_00476 [Strigomonas culicis]|eukprot:EPY36648.1 hypothetical protein STCU_00476 [Strigomonas culicis]